MKYLAKKINNKHVVWFEQTNSWVQLEEPACFVSKLFWKGLDNQSISDKCVKKYKLNKNESLQFVNTICANLSELCKSSSNSIENKKSVDFTNSDVLNKYSTRFYIIGNKQLAIEYYSRMAEYYIHPPLAHLEAKEIIGVADEQFFIISKGAAHVLRKKNDKKFSYVTEDFGKLKKCLFVEIANTIYNKENNDWLSIVHASALTDGNQTLLLSSASGSGKSFMAALLQTRGLQVVSDDFVPIDAKTRKAHPFPAAISVKESAFSLLSSYYSNLNDSNYNTYELSPRTIKYLHPKTSNLPETDAMKVKNIIFIHYNPELQCKFNRISTLEALKLFHEQAWVSRNPKHAKTFINWFVKLRCFNLEYGDSEKGIEKIVGVFEDRTAK